MFAVLVLLTVSLINQNVDCQSLVIDLNGFTECIPFDSIETISSTQVGWIKIMSCIENGDAYTYYYTSNEVAILAANAISFRFQPPGGTSNSKYDDLAVTALPYSTPITSYLNNVQEISYDGTQSCVWCCQCTDDWSENWDGSLSAKDHLQNRCVAGGAPHDFRNRIYHACDNQQGLHVFPNMLGDPGYTQCDWSGGDVIGSDMEILLGFTPETCPPTVSPTKNPTANLSIPPTSDPSANPTINPSVDPTISPSNFPTKSPSYEPTIEATTKAPTAVRAI